MLLVDANVLVYAVDADSVHHRKAHAWLEAALSADRPVGLAWVVTLAFLRITTRAGILRRPLDADAAIAYVDSWFSQPFVQPVVPGPRHWTVFRGLVRAAGTAGNLTSDAHLAALAIEYGAPVVTTDHDFRRFPGVEVIDPRA